MPRYAGGHDDDSDIVRSTSGRGETMQDVLARRWSRRGFVGAGLASGLTLTLAPGARAATATQATPEAAEPAGSRVFAPIELDAGDDIVVAAGHTAVPFLKWGDPIFPDTPEWSVDRQSAEAQERQFGYNCDWIGYLPLPPGSDASDRGLLVVNHEYTNPELMFPGYATPDPDDDAGFLLHPTREIVDTSLAAHGLSVVEIARDDAGAWRIVLDSARNRRITGTTPMDIAGPAAGSDLLRTNEDPTGARAIGTLANCAGGITPWGTVLTGEENFQFYFANLDALPADDPVRAAHARYGVSEAESLHRWEAFYPRFDLAHEPNEAFRFGWVVEFDPYDPGSTPKKRTALGRFKHEGATSAIAPGGQVAFYSGDDERFEYAYKFVTAGRHDPGNPDASRDLLDEGTLYVARFHDDGSGEWLPLVHGAGLLTEAFGFADQGEVLAKTRLAADAVGATKMDRPEDFETNPVTGKVYLSCTNNSRRAMDQVDMANPRPENFAGHIIEIAEAGGDHAATRFAWEIFILAGDPAGGGTWYGGHEGVSPLAAPDNLTFDLDGNIWISTDGIPDTMAGNDGLFMAPTEGEERGFTRQFFSTVPGAECSGPVFNPDNTALWVSVQHPGEGSTLAEPTSAWPDGDAPRPSVVLITSDAGGRVGTA